MTSEASDLSEFWGLQWLIDRGVEGARERQDALLDRRATESVTERAAFESAFEDAPVWPTPIAVPGPSAVPCGLRGGSGDPGRYEVRPDHRGPPRGAT